MKKISVIVPIYNSEKYLEHCINSIINQTYKNLEIILVDNKSTDCSLEICERFLTKDTRIKLFLEEHPGAAYARNCGISHVTGDYLTFVDSDDYLLENAYELLINRIEETSADIVCYSYNVVDNEGCPLGYYEPQLSRYMSKKLYSGVEAAKIYITSDDIGGFGWNKIFRTSYLKKSEIRFDESKTAYEDMVSIFALIINCSKVTFFNEKLYYYRQTPFSLTHTNYKKKEYEFQDSVNKIAGMAESKGLIKEVEIYHSYICALNNWMRYKCKDFDTITWPMGRFSVLKNLLLGYNSEKLLWLIKLFIIYINRIGK